MNTENKTVLTIDDIVQMTFQVGEGWATAHARRLLELIREIGQDLAFDAQTLTLAAYLHDWGAFPLYFQKGVDHALRSRQVVEAEILAKLEITPINGQVLLEAIELHDYRDNRQPHSAEALLLREADMLEFLGMMGMAREFARGPKDVSVCYRRILDRRAGIADRFSLPRARELAQVRLERMNQCLGWLLEESSGIL
jgi:HD superfamily phosphodiesterase